MIYLLNNATDFRNLITTLQMSFSFCSGNWANIAHPYYSGSSILAGEIASAEFIENAGKVDVNSIRKAFEKISAYEKDPEKKDAWDSALVETICRYTELNYPVLVNISDGNGSLSFTFQQITTATPNEIYLYPYKYRMGTVNRTPQEMIAAIKNGNHDCTLTAYCYYIDPVKGLHLTECPGIREDARRKYEEVHSVETIPPEAAIKELEEAIPVFEDVLTKPEDDPAVNITYLVERRDEWMAIWSCPKRRRVVELSFNLREAI